MEPHDEPCGRCPAYHFPLDPEAEDILNWPIEEMEKMQFVCAWRPTKLCRGNWDQIKREIERRHRDGDMAGRSLLVGGEAGR